MGEDKSGVRIRQIKSGRYFLTPEYFDVRVVFTL